MKSGKKLRMRHRSRIAPKAYSGYEMIPRPVPVARIASELFSLPPL